MKEIIIIKEFDCHFSNDSMKIIGTAETIEKAEQLICDKYSNNYMIVQNGTNQVFIDDLSGDFTEFGISYDKHLFNSID